MKLLWLCNMVPGPVKQAITGKAGNGLWVDHVLQDLQRREELTLRVFCPYGEELSGDVNSRCSYRTFRTRLPHQYLPELESRFRRELEEFKPDVIHIWGTEYAHTLAMVNAAWAAGFHSRVVVSIQGLCSVYTEHYAEGLPQRVQRRYTLRDLLKRENVRRQQELFRRRGVLEVNALEQVSHVIGRTAWDRACTYDIQPEAAYHFCNETLRDVFYEDQWDYHRCTKHRIFASSCVYPIKGFHYLLQAMALVARDYPDVTLAVPGRNYRKADLLHQSSYQKYLTELTRQHGLEDKIEFLGSLDGQGMKQAYLDANVFVLPSTIENSPNSLGEAMLLGVPCVAADVGGVTTMMTHEKEGFVYPSTAPYLLAHYIRTVFAMEDAAAALGQAARAHALKTHDPDVNFSTLLDIYTEIAT